MQDEQPSKQQEQQQQEQKQQPAAQPEQQLATKPAADQQQQQQPESPAAQQPAAPAAPADPAPLPWKPVLSAAQLKRGLSFYGTGQRIERFAAKLMAGQPVTAVSCAAEQRLECLSAGQWIKQRLRLHATACAAHLLACKEHLQANLQGTTALWVAPLALSARWLARCLTLGSRCAGDHWRLCYLGRGGHQPHRDQRPRQVCKCRALSVLFAWPQCAAA